MSVICSLPYSEAATYRGLTVKAKYNGKVHQVFFKVLCDEVTLNESIELAKVSKNVLMLEYQGMDTAKSYLGLRDTGVYLGKITACGNNFTEDELERIVSDTPDCVTPIIEFPDDFCDMHLLWKLQKKFPKVRFCGGKLFAIDGVNVGAVGVDILTKNNVKFDEDSFLLDCSIDAIDDVDFSDLSELKTSANGGLKHSSTPKQSGKRPQVSFASIMSSSGFVDP